MSIFLLHCRQLAVCSLFSMVLFANPATADQVIYDNTNLSHNGEMFFPGPGDHFFAQPFALGNHSALSSVTVTMALGEFDRGTVQGTVPFTLWNDLDGHPGEQIAELGVIDVQELRPSIFPRYTINEITFESPVTGLAPDATYYVVGDQTHLEGNTVGPPPETIFVPYLSRSQGTTGTSLQVNVNSVEPIEWTDDFGFGKRFLQMSVTATNAIPILPPIDYGQDRLIFSEPENVLSVSSNRFENFPHLSDDGLRIYFSSDASDSNNLAPFGELPEIYMAERSSLDEPFRDRIRLGGKQGHVNFLGSVSPDERSIYYASFEPPTGHQIVYYATRDSVGHQFDFDNAIPLMELNELGADVQLGHVGNGGLSIYFNAHNGEVSQAYVATRQSTSEPFSNPKPIGDAEFLVEHEISNGLALLSWSRATGSASDADLLIASRDSKDEEFSRWRNLGPVLNTSADETFPYLHERTATLYFSSDRPGTIVPQEGPPCCAPIRDFWQSQVSFAGDFDFDRKFTSSDIDMLSAAIRSGGYHYNLDNNQDGQVDNKDHVLWVTGSEFVNSYLGDANLDGEFNSGDFVEVFQAGKYETIEAAGWNQGDWNADGVFNTTDFIAAFQDGGYERGPRDLLSAVPEPSSDALLVIAMIGFFRLRKRE